MHKNTNRLLALVLDVPDSFIKVTTDLGYGIRFSIWVEKFSRKNSGEDIEVIDESYEEIREIKKSELVILIQESFILKFNTPIKTWLDIEGFNKTQPYRNQERDIVGWAEISTYNMHYKIKSKAVVDACIEAAATALDQVKENRGN